jgi:hypothetical protein
MAGLMQENSFCIRFGLDPISISGMIPLAFENIDRQPSRVHRPAHNREAPSGRKVSAMTEELRAQLASLRNVAPMLNKATDDATSSIKAVETLLKTLGLQGRSDPFQARVLTKSDPESSESIHDDIDRGCIFNRVYYLRYARINGEFSINVLIDTQFSESGGQCDDWRSIGEESIPWPSCSREIKLKAVTKLAALIGNIASYAASLAESANEATALTQAALEALGAPDEPVKPKSKTRS